MTLEPVTSMIQALPSQAPVSTSVRAESAGFSDWLDLQLATTNRQLIQADEGVRKLALGETDNLHQVMIDLEKARLSFELIVQVRNKMLDAYQDLMRMQI